MTLVVDPTRSTLQEPKLPLRDSPDMLERLHPGQLKPVHLEQSELEVQMEQSEQEVVQVQ